MRVLRESVMISDCGYVAPELGAPLPASNSLSGMSYVALAAGSSLAGLMLVIGVVILALLVRRRKRCVDQPVNCKIIFFLYTHTKAKLTLRLTYVAGARSRNRLWHQLLAAWITHS